MSWIAASSISEGSCAVASQRSVALTAPITIIVTGEMEIFGDSAKTTISAITPNTHSPAIVEPPRPVACQVMDAKL
jgi:hypothetical protein